jgi:hypothetical protein
MGKWLTELIEALNGLTELALSCLGRSSQPRVPGGRFIEEPGGGKGGELALPSSPCGEGILQGVVLESPLFPARWGEGASRSLWGGGLWAGMQGRRSVGGSSCAGGFSTPDSL